MKLPLEDRPVFIQAICYLLFGFVAAMTVTLVVLAAKDALRNGE